MYIGWAQLHAWTTLLELTLNAYSITCVWSVLSRIFLMMSPVSCRSAWPYKPHYTGRYQQCIRYTRGAGAEGSVRAACHWPSSTSVVDVVIDAVNLQQEMHIHATGLEIWWLGCSPAACRASWRRVPGKVLGHCRTTSLETLCCSRGSDSGVLVGKVPLSQKTWPLAGFWPGPWDLMPLSWPPSSALQYGYPWVSPRCRWL